MSIAMFAMLGVAVKAGFWYWFCFAGFCIIKVVKATIETLKESGNL